MRKILNADCRNPGLLLGDLDEAIGIAARIPSAKVGSIEVRPVRVMT